MGLLDSAQRAKGKHVFSDEVKSQLIPDGLIHVIMVESIAKFESNRFTVDGKYTNQINAILTKMQKNGYQILNIQNSSITGNKVSPTIEFTTLISYQYINRP